MGDPFSISTGIAGLISLGITLGNGLHTYFSAIKDRHSDIETAQKSLGLFQFNIHILRSNEAKISRHHGLAADGLTLGVINCEAHLKSLEDLLNELTNTEGSTTLKQTLRKQKMISRYPFDKKKLVQLQEQLSGANTALHNFIFTLLLESVLDISKNLEALTVASEARNPSTQTISKMVGTQLSIAAPKKENSTLDIALFPARTAQKLPTTSNGSTAQHSGLSNLDLELVSRSSARIFKQFIKANSKPRYLQNTEWETRLCNNLAASICSCGILANNSSQLYQVSRGFTIYKRGLTAGYHLPGCPFYARYQREASKVLLRLSWLLSIFSIAFTFSISKENPSGYYNIAFNLRSCHIVKNSPALEFFVRGDYDKASHTFFAVLHDYYMKYGVENMAEGIIQQLRIFYESGKSSPFDIDEDGNNIAHRCIEVSNTPLVIDCL
ncbi:hypothetical protein FBEOM_7663 [Fusarium beomiforme]|uniref:Fungal N-terminal domain-containing protein n=1 Tax=Fusarium beomiforme TaxID=44412 RepID=A0A9P5AGQ6_9HYPO|nr:hypothetical protein FBEOM_7663 [Fusarium beomiforme]